MKVSSKLIIFSYELQSGENIFGFKIASPNEYKQIIKALKLLENNQSQFSYNNQYYQYSLEDFNFQSISSSEIKQFNKFFDLAADDNESSTIGFFPNILEDAYEDNLISDQEETDEFEGDYDDNY